jgi:hypothetical protein
LTIIPNITQGYCWRGTQNYKNAKQQINKVVVQAAYILNTVVILPQLCNEYGKKHIVAKDVVGLLVGDSKNNREFD